MKTPQHRGNQAIDQTIQLLEQLQQQRQTRQQIIDNMWERLNSPESDYDEQENLQRQIQQHSKSYRRVNKELLEQMQAYLQVISSALKSEYQKPK